MKKNLKIAALPMTVLAAVSVTGCSEKATGEKPNIVILLADDLGYGDIRLPRKQYQNRFGIRETVIPPWREYGLDETEKTKQPGGRQMPLRQKP